MFLKETNRKKEKIIYGQTGPKNIKLFLKQTPNNEREKKN